MLTRLFALITKELLASARDRQTRFIILIAPPFLLLIYVFAITQDVTNLSVGVVNRDEGRFSREILERVSASPRFRSVTYFEDADALARAIDEQAVLVGLRIQSDFSRRILRGQGAELQILLDGRRSNAAQIVSGYVLRIVQDYNVELMQSVGQTLPATVLSRTWFNANSEPLWAATPALFAVLSAIVGFMVSALSVARERELGTFEQLLVSPLTPIEILIGKTLPALLIALASSAVMLAFSYLILNVPIRGNLVALFLAMIAFLLSIIGIGLFISSLVRTQQQAVIGLFVYMIPAVLLSGYATPVENMPGWLQIVAQSNPITHFIVICKAVFLRDAPGLVIWAHTWPLLLIALVTLSAGTWLFTRRLA